MPRPTPESNIDSPPVAEPTSVSRLPTAALTPPPSSWYSLPRAFAANGAWPDPRAVEITDCACIGRAPRRPSAPACSCAGRNGRRTDSPSPADDAETAVSSATQMRAKNVLSVRLGALRTPTGSTPPTTASDRIVGCRRLIPRDRPIRASTHSATPCRVRYRPARARRACDDLAALACNSSRPVGRPICALRHRKKEPADPPHEALPSSAARVSARLGRRLACDVIR